MTYLVIVLAATTFASIILVLGSYFVWKSDQKRIRSQMAEIRDLMIKNDKMESHISELEDTAMIHDEKWYVHDNHELRKKLEDFEWRYNKLCDEYEELEDQVYYLDMDIEHYVDRNHELQYRIEELQFEIDNLKNGGY